MSRLNILKDWLDECMADHVHCRHGVESETILPTRVLEILPEAPDATKEDLLGSRLRLENKVDDTTKDPLGLRLRITNRAERGRYIALSHCWGTNTPLKTTARNLKEHEQRIGWNDLPVTFQDAVLMAAYIGIPYIWIDSLCIIQGEIPRVSTSMPC